MSSMYTHTKIPKWSRRTSFTTGWNVNGTLQRQKGHNNPFEGAKLCVEGGFLDISNLVEPADKVYLPKYGGTPQCTQDGLDRR